MRRSLAWYSTPVSFVHVPSWADFITITSGFRFSVHTAVRRQLFSQTSALTECESVVLRSSLGAGTQTSSINGTTMFLKCVSVFDMQCISIHECAQRLTDLTYF